MKNYIVLDTQIIIDLLNKKGQLNEAINILKAMYEKDAIIGLTVFSFYELFKKVDKDRDYYRINHFLATGVDFVLSDRRIDKTGLLNPEKWDKGFDENTFDYTGFKTAIRHLKSRIKEFYIEQMTCFVTSVLGLIIFIKVLIGGLDIRFFKLFVVLETSKLITPSRSEMIKSTISAHFDCDDFYDKEASKNVIDSIIMDCMGMLTNGFCSGKKAFLSKGDVNKALRSKQSILNTMKSVLDLSSSEKFVDSFFKHLNRINDDNVTVRGLNLLFNKYFFGRRVSINDFVDLSNIDSINCSSNISTVFYVTREVFWNKQFVDEFASDLSNITNCRIIGMKS